MMKTTKHGSIIGWLSQKLLSYKGLKFVYQVIRINHAGQKFAYIGHRVDVNLLITYDVVFLNKRGENMKYLKYPILITILLFTNISRINASAGGVICYHNGYVFTASATATCPLPDPNSHLEVLNNPHSDINDPKCVLTQTYGF